MRHLFVTASRIGARVHNFSVKDAETRKQHTTTDDSSKLHNLSEQELDLLTELVAISVVYSESRDIRGALADFNPTMATTGGK